MKNLFSKLKDSLGVSDAYAEEPRSIRKIRLPYSRTHFRPSYKMEGKRVIPTKKREYVDDKNLVQEEERPFFDGLGKPDLGYPKEKYKGLIEEGNVDLKHRPHVKNSDGSTSSIRSMSFNEGGREILVPTVSEDGRIMSDDEAVQQYHKTGRHLGKFDNPDNATNYAERLHSDQANMMNLGGLGNPKQDVRKRTKVK